MNQGAYRAGTPIRVVDTQATVDDDMPDETMMPLIEPDLTGAEPIATTRAERVVLALLGVAVLAWVAVIGWFAATGIADGTIAIGDVARGVSIASGPLALVGVLLVLWQRNAPHEAARFADAARGVRMEALALDAVLGLASRRLADDRAGVAAQADALLDIADRTSDRLREATAALAEQIGDLGRRSRDLDAAAGTARVDMGVMLADLPTAEEKVRALGEALRETGLGAHEQSAALQAALAGIVQRGREAEESAGGAANRLSAQVSQIAGASEVTARDIDAATQRMTTSIEGVMARVRDAVEQARAGVDAQGEAVGAMIERARAAADAGAAATAASFEARLAALTLEIAKVAALLAEQDGVGAAMIERIQRGLSAVEARFAELDETGGARTRRLGEALGQLWTHAERTMTSLNDGGTAATTLINRTETLHAAIRAALVDIDETLPGAMMKLEGDASRARDAAAAAAPDVERLGASAAAAADALGSANAEIDARRTAIDGITDRITARLAGARHEAEALDAVVADVDAKAATLADATSPKLVDALIRVRETAGQAAQRAREALGAIVPHSANALGEASRVALDAAVGDAVEGQIARVNAAAESAVEAARIAAARLDDQLARVADTSASVEAHVAAGKAEVEASDRDSLSKRVALLIDSLNSTAIDISKLMSNEPGDSAWAAYLRGDRGVFTRRAVKLLESGEARTIARSYEESAEFRDQVNRYVHDFEALLRPILATRDGQALGVVLLSSEMGKLYVGLAQAIERLRA